MSDLPSPKTSLQQPPALGDIADRLARDPGWTPWPVPEVRETTGSTMVDVEELARSGAPEGTVVVAEHQAAGRGRLGRSWESAPRSGLWLSVLLRPAQTGRTAISRLPLVVGCAVSTALDRQVGHAVPGLGLKWPNDVVRVDGDEVRKLGGILAERLADGAVVVGVGLNVTQARHVLPPGGTSLVAESPGLADRADLRSDLLVAILVEIARAYREWADHQWSLEDYRSRCITLGRAVVATVAAGEGVVGTAVDVDDAGHLVVVTALGERRVVAAGDVSIRAAGPGSPG